MNQERPFRPLQPAIRLPGLEAHPDLERRFRAEERSLGGCSGCARTALIRKYQQELRQRNRQRR